MMAQALARMGIDRAFVVHGADGLDEISTTGPTTVFQVEENGVQKGRWQPSDFGLPEATLEDLQGGDSETNAAIIRGDSRRRTRAEARFRDCQCGGRAICGAQSD